HDRVDHRAPGLTARRERLGRAKTAAKLGFDQVDTPYRLDHLVDPRAAHPGVHLDHAGAATGALALPVEHSAGEPERLNGPHAQIDHPAHRLLVVIGG